MVTVSHSLPPLRGTFLADNPLPRTIRSMKNRFADGQSSQLLCLCKYPHVGFTFAKVLLLDVELFTELWTGGTSFLSFKEVTVLNSPSEFGNKASAVILIYLFMWMLLRFFIFLLVLSNLMVTSLGQFPSCLLSLASLGPLDPGVVSIRTHCSRDFTNIFPTLFLIFPFEIPVTGV